jgi:hypothetical protein
MRITEQTEEQAAKRRVRQDKRVPFLINEEDGRLYPNTELMRKKPGYRLYHGKSTDSLEDRKRYLLGLSNRRAVAYQPEPEQPFDLNAATFEELLTFAQDQYGVVLDSSKPLSKVRDEVYRLSQLPESELLTALGGDGATDTRIAGDVRDPENEIEIPTLRSHVESGSPADIAAGVARNQAQVGRGAGLGLGGAQRTQPEGAAIEPARPTRGGRQPRTQAEST